MLSNFLIKKFIKNNDDINDNKVRIAYGNLGGAVGIIINTLLFLIKLFVGLFAGSIAIIADAFNNLSDAASSIITIIGFKMANKPADAEHPFGHGRIEYISALVVSFMVMLVGFQFVKTSFYKILNPEEPDNTKPAQPTDTKKDNQSTNKVETTNQKTTSVKTGDETNIVIFVSLSMVSGGLFLVLRKEYERVY